MIENEPSQKSDSTIRPGDIGPITQDKPGYDIASVERLLEGIILGYVEKDIAQEIEIRPEDSEYILAPHPERIGISLRRVGKELSERVRRDSL